MTLTQPKFAVHVSLTINLTLHVGYGTRELTSSNSGYNFSVRVLLYSLWLGLYEEDIQISFRLWYGYVKDPSFGKIAQG